MTNIKTRRLALAGLFCALIYVFTAFVHIPTGLGYTHAGDGFIYLVASVLPAPLAAAAGAVGAGLADVSSGMAIWLPATLVLKALTALCFTSKNEMIICRRNLLALIPALLLNVFGYSFYEAAIMTKGSLGAAFGSAIAQAPFYTIQTLIGAAIYLTLGRTLAPFIRRSLRA
ncbi:MAG: ECF transporter S component [Ruminococcus sp.]|nr:ECF transporter S component [Ruminococcus sp.]